jgi:methyl-accepting chemotaxis protein
MHPETPLPDSINGAQLLGTDKQVLTNNIATLMAFRDETATEAALIQKIDGKYLRTATLLKDSNGQPMIGSEVKNTDPVVQAIEQKKAYSGIVFRNGKFSVTRSEPILDGDTILGYLSVRVVLEQEIKQLADELAKIRIGQSGVISAFSLEKGDDIARYTIHPQHPGKTIKDIGDSELGSLIEQAIKQQEGAIRSKLGGQERLDYFVANPKWGWMLTGGAPLAEITATQNRLRNILIAGCVGILLLTLGLLYFTISQQLRPLDLVVSKVQSLGAGDLSVRITTTGTNTRNEIELLGFEVNRMAERLSDLVRHVTGIATQLTGSAHELQFSSQQLSQSAAVQSDSSSSMAASVEEWTVSISHVADSAGHASALGEEAHRATAQAQQTIGTSISEMQQIASNLDASSQTVLTLGEQSQRISGIVNVIKEIADQTNLLALNAAIEAARAGEQGRGFAVVADEVRKLAERTSQSTREIAGMISGIQSESVTASSQIRAVNEQMHLGVRRVEQAGSALSEIAGQIEQTVDMVRDIASSTREQSTATQSVARGVESIAQMAEENSGASQSNREEARRLEALAQELASSVATLKT